MASAPFGGAVRGATGRMAGPAGARRWCRIHAVRCRLHGAHPLRRAQRTLGQQFVVEIAAAPAARSARPAARQGRRPTANSILHDRHGVLGRPVSLRAPAVRLRQGLDPVLLVSLVPNILVVTPSVPVKTIADVIRLRSRRRRRMRHTPCRLSGNGTLQDEPLPVKLFKSKGDALVLKKAAQCAVSRRRSGDRPM